MLFAAAIVLLVCCKKDDPGVNCNNGGNENSGGGQSQTLTLQPDASTGKDATIWYIESQSTSKGPTNTSNYGYDAEFPAMEWTFDGSYGTKQGLVQFDLSGIPSNSTIVNAQLSLYNCDSCGDPGHALINVSNPNGTNQGLVQRVTSSWDENAVTWNTRPSFTTQNQVILPASTSASEDYTNINVTALVQDMLTNSSTSYGFLVSMQDTTIYRRLIFASSDHINPAKHPKLVVQYK